MGPPVSIVNIFEDALRQGLCRQREVVAAAFGKFKTEQAVIFDHVRRPPLNQLIVVEHALPRCGVGENDESGSRWVVLNSVYKLVTRETTCLSDRESAVAVEALPRRESEVRKLV